MTLLCIHLIYVEPVMCIVYIERLTNHLHWNADQYFTRIVVFCSTFVEYLLLFHTQIDNS